MTTSSILDALLNSTQIDYVHTHVIIELRNTQATRNTLLLRAITQYYIRFSPLMSLCQSLLAV